MNENTQHKISTGMFAKLCGIPKKTLLYYDKIGLFQPDYVAENGYRYYSYRQFDLLFVILGLRGVGMPLKEIKSYVDHRTPEDMMRLFVREDRKLQQEIKRMKSTRRFLQTRIELTRQALQTNTEIIRLEEHETEHLAVTNTSQLQSQKDISAAWRNHIQRYMENGMNIGYPDGTMVRVEDIQKGNYLKYAYFFTKTDRFFEEVDFFEKSKGLYLTAFHKGSYDETGITYDQLLSYAKERGIELYGYAFEEGLLDELAVQTAKDMLMKISIRVKETSDVLR